MNTFEDIDPDPTHSIVATSFDQFSCHEKPPELTYQGQQVLLLRRIVEGSITDLTIAEVRTLIAENAPEEGF